MLDLKQCYTFEVLYKNLWDIRDKINGLLSAHKNKFQLEWAGNPNPFLRFSISLEIDKEETIAKDGGSRHEELVEIAKQTLIQYGIEEREISKDPESFKFTLCEGDKHQIALEFNFENKANK